MSEALAGPPEVVGLRNVLRARWKALPFWYRVAFTIALELLVAIGLFFVDRSLGYAVATVAAIFWLRRLPPLPWRLAGELVLISIFLFSGVGSLAARLAIAFGGFWVPPRPRTWGRPVAAAGPSQGGAAGRCGHARRPLSVLCVEDVRDPRVRGLAGRRDGCLH